MIGRDGLLMTERRERHVREIGLIWNSVVMMDIVLAVMSCITIATLYEAFQM